MKQSFMLVGKSQVSMCKHEKLRMNIFFSTLRVILKVGMSDYLFFAQNTVKHKSSSNIRIHLLTILDLILEMIQ